MFYIYIWTLHVKKMRFEPWWLKKWFKKQIWTFMAKKTDMSYFWFLTTSHHISLACRPVGPLACRPINGADGTDGADGADRADRADRADMEMGFVLQRRPASECGPIYRDHIHASGRSSSTEEDLLPIFIHFALHSSIHYRFRRRYYCFLSSGYMYTQRSLLQVGKKGDQS
jgi:hypothetical protein